MSRRRPPYPAWIYRQSAVLPYRWRDGRLEVLLVTSRGGKRWVLPKGIVDPGLDPGASAAKEALEEAGVAGFVHDTPLGTYRQRKWGGTCVVTVYPMHVSRELDAWPEGAIRRRRWRRHARAIERLKGGDVRAVAGRLPKALAEADVITEPASWAPATRPRLVHLLRHAEAERAADGQDDRDRPLAPAGLADCEAMTRYLWMADVQPDVVLCSDARRARETFDALAGALGEDVEVAYRDSLYDADAAVVLGHLREVADAQRTVLVVGHAPVLRDVAVRLAGRGDAEALARIHERFPAGAVATLVHRGESWSSLAEGTCALHSFVTPGEIGKEPTDHEGDD